jgi:small subunit ribosomal protein S24e
MSEFITLEDRNNSLLNRREVKVTFKNAAGRVKRIDASEMLAKQFNIDKKAVIPVRMSGETGKTDLHGTFYIYHNEEEAKKQLPRYMILRTMPKEERKKLINEEKAARLKAKQAAAAKSKGKTNRGK